MIFICMDFGWILFNKNLYFGTIKDVQKSDFQSRNIAYVFITYIIMLLGLFIICMNFVESQIKTYNTTNANIVAFMSGAFYGSIINGIYNFTNVVAFKDYSVYVSIVDIFWAFFLYGTISVIYINLLSS